MISEKGSDLSYYYTLFYIPAGDDSSVLTTPSFIFSLYNIFATFMIGMKYQKGILILASAYVVAGCCSIIPSCLAQEQEKEESEEGECLNGDVDNGTASSTSRQRTHAG